MADRRWAANLFGLAVVAGLLTTPTAAAAEETLLVLDPERSAVSFALGASLHTVRGAFQLERGEIRVDPSGGPASGEVVVDATSGETGIDARDRKMHGEVLKSSQYPRIVFLPDAVRVLEQPSTERLVVEATGTMRVLASTHPFRARIEVTRREGNEVFLRTAFTVPYVAWGLEDVSTFLLRVADEVEVTLEAYGTLSSPAAPR